MTSVASFSSEPQGPGARVARNEVQLACFRVGGQLYALDIMLIREIIRIQKITPVPGVPRFVEGVINLRGVVIPVVDLRHRFSVQPQGEGRKNRVLVCAVAGRIIGLVVDEVHEVRTFTRRDILAAPQFLARAKAAYFMGVCRVNEDVMMILDVERILLSEEDIAMSETRAQPPC